MKSLTSVNPTSEQLLIVKRIRSGPELIRGAAGSGKTTTAVLKLKLLLLWVLSRRRRDESTAPVNALVLTFNKTLRGYVDEIVQANTPTGNINVTVDTFGHWAYQILGQPQICQEGSLEEFCNLAAAKIGLPPSFIANEAAYILA